MSEPVSPLWSVSQRGVYFNWICLQQIAFIHSNLTACFELTESGSKFCELTLKTPEEDNKDTSANLTDTNET